MKRKDFITNIVIGFGGQLIILILGIVIPRIMITSYGSDTNGLLATVGQIFTYLMLLEAGVGQSARIALYKPLSENNKDEVSMVYRSAEKYFRKITFFYAIVVVLLMIIAPYTIKTEIEYSTTRMIILFEGVSGVVTFYFLQAPMILLNAAGKGYVANGVNVIISIIIYAVKIILAINGFNILVIQFTYCVITIIKVVIFYLYIRKHFSWLKRSVKTDKNLLKDRNSYLITEIAWTIFASTDMIVLSTFLGTKMSSVYSVYNLIFANISLLLDTVGGSVLYVLGQVYYKSIQEYESVHDAFNTMFFSAITALISVCYILIIPFIRLYTKDVTDVEYVHSGLPVLFSLVQMLSWNRYVPGNLTGIAGYAKSTSYISLLEAVVNVFLSIVLVAKFGIVGVLLATVIALPIKVVWCIYICDRKIMSRSFKKSLRTFGINYAIFFLVVAISRYIKMNIDSYGMFIIYGICCTFIVALIVVGINFLANRDCWRIIRKYLMKK